ncbi:NAD(FAD)-utilizing dehydrogenase [Lysinibacillus xylanilyticus]|uniref:NAD(FAD)-utilizing dehydrogenase n=1 Tax=Lysinibacillus xylanilyticus TaxID=582475 RepID=A0A0K9FDF5_9BACI|nr:NAD(FAD)-utilizing dehydrogenase [Lysinibacillus xylanilyticus]KMY32287.1 NAD(FAD)-utilizing dehydrogenase [Lysinibacillus xylanilyticus]
MYDITVIGSGVSSIFLAYALSQSNQKILILEKGKSIEKRNCPLDRGETCNCKICDKYFGFAGLGKSEGKFNYASDFGGELEQKLGRENLLQLMDEVDEILCRFGGDSVIKYSTANTELSKRAQLCNLQMLTTEVRHLGTSLSTDIFHQIYKVLSSKIDIQFEVDVQEIIKDNDSFTLITNKGDIQSQQVVFATGRSGTDWLNKQCASLGVKQGKTRLDLGIRVEMAEQQLRSILEDTFETKLAYAHGDIISTTYCMNPKGRIIRKYQEGLVMPDGQNFREQKNGTSNLNFTLFTPTYFSTLKEANMYAHKVIGEINKGIDRIVVQRYGDLRKGQSTTKENMYNNRIQPSLKADFGDLTKEIPLLYIQILQGFLNHLEEFIGEAIDEDTLLYGMDGKFYSPTIETDENFQTNIQGLYVIGDCSGVTHSLSHAASSGIFVGKYLARNC